MLKETADLVRDGVPNIYLFYLLSIFFSKNWNWTRCVGVGKILIWSVVWLLTHRKYDRVFIRLIMIKIFVGCRWCSPQFSENTVFYIERLSSAAPLGMMMIDDDEYWECKAGWQYMVAPPVGFQTGRQRGSWCDFPRGCRYLKNN